MSCSFQGPERAQPEGLSGWSLKTQQYAPAPEDTSSRFGRRSRCASRPEGLRPAPYKELPRKEVIQPHLPVRLPCYDFTPITSPTFDGSLPRVGSPASG